MERDTSLCDINFSASHPYSGLREESHIFRFSDDRDASIRIEQQKSTRKGGNRSMEGENPCNLCQSRDCLDQDCILQRIYNKVNECSVGACFLNYEGSCLLSLYDDCGCRKGKERNA